VFGNIRSAQAFVMNMVQGNRSGGINNAGAAAIGANLLIANNQQ
jgi:hypothetical protein